MKTRLLLVALFNMIVLVGCKTLEPNGLPNAMTHATASHVNYPHGSGPAVNNANLREVYRGHITGFIDPYGRPQERFRGCVPGRRLIIDERFTVTCREYRNVQAYRPPVTIVSDGYNNFLVYGNDRIRVSRY